MQGPMPINGRTYVQSERSLSDSTALPHPPTPAPPTSCPVRKTITGHWLPCTSVCSLWIVVNEFTQNRACLEVTYRIVEFLN